MATFWYEGGGIGLTLAFYGFKSCILIRVIIDSWSSRWLTGYIT